MDLGPKAWTRLPPETCQRLGLAIVERVQNRLRRLPEQVLDTPLPDPKTMLAFPIETRTANALLRACRPGEPVGRWTLRRYLEISRFGGRRVVDLLTAAEAHGLAAPQSASTRALSDAVGVVARNLPMSEQQASRALTRLGMWMLPESIDLGELARATVKLGLTAPFHVIKIGGARIAVRLNQITAALTAYRIASRAIANWGAGSTPAIAGQLRTQVRTAGTDLTFVERLLAGLETFRWIDRPGGWFWFKTPRNPLKDDLGKILSVAPRIPVTSAWEALFRRRPGPRPSPEAIRQICAEVPGVQVVRGEIVAEGSFSRSLYLNKGENRAVAILEAAGGQLPEAQIRTSVRDSGSSWAPVSQALRGSPLFERQPRGLIRLIAGSENTERVEIRPPPAPPKVRRAAA